MPRPTIAIFTKAPVPGSVKTRMLDRLTPEQAAELHRRSFALICAEAIAVDGADVVVAVTPDEADLATPGRLRLMPQGSGDLGARLNRVVDRLFADGAGPVIVVGCDCVELDRTLLSEAFQRLTTHDCVIGPALDGGYYLLGMRQPAPVLFEGVDWGSEHVLAQTRDRTAAAGLSVAELPPRRDLDTADDLAALIDDVDADHPRLGSFVRHVRRLDIFGGHRD